MSPTTAGSIAGYQVDKAVIKKMKKTKVKSFVPVTFSPQYSPSNNSVILRIAGKNPFTLGGQITVITTPPNAVTSSGGAPLSGTNVFQILPNAKNITGG
jgi:hypothetical protein